MTTAIFLTIFDSVKFKNSNLLLVSVPIMLTVLLPAEDDGLVNVLPVSTSENKPVLLPHQSCSDFETCIFKGIMKNSCFRCGIPVTTTKSVITAETPTTTTSENDKIAGDVNLDGRVTVADVIMLQKYFVKAVKFSDLQYGTADFNEDDIVNIFDVIGLKSFLLYSE